LLCLTFSALLPGALFCQDTGYRIEEDGGIVQILNWSRSNAYFYEIEIQRRGESGEWEPYAAERTEEIFLEVTLPPGLYRYRIISYNVLGRPAAESSWTGLRIFPAREPAVDSFTPPAFHADRGHKEFTLVLRGSDLQDEAELYIIAKTEGAKPITPLSVQYARDETEILAVFSAESLELGPYDIVVTNPGGLLRVVAGFAVSFASPVDITFSLGWTPLLPLYGSLFTEYDSPFYPLGLSARFSVLPYKRLWGNLGGELVFRFTSLKTSDEDFTLEGRMFFTGAAILYQKRFRDYTAALSLKLGGGLAPVVNMRFTHNDGSNSEKAAVLFTALFAGLSWQQQLWRGLYLEAGLDYIQLLSAPALIHLNTAAGWRF
jgi:hypothetical protein